ncbi:glycoside hydrolase family 3 C-terminal domain-containing protein [Streptomyces sp. NBC_00365]|uniref:beta-glucosidase n=1 Tax=Streptomyces sp. NBC_00365 TaxID=2975726 RepID=UPI0022557ECD|nr:glycoside hydrolase family 3 C-terminal domain-containing protein [Streptomyces sp. NBC_00365]MCX5087562.1 glycoside hydrolase family 3 C-terminal domain-containing protein [Streptomyces sp. NBC_00365]
MTAGLPTAAAAAPLTAAEADQPWQDRRKPAARRADALLEAMTFEEQVVLVTAVEVADSKPLEHLGIPAMTRVDASDGLRGDTGVTAFPAPNALAATFDTDLAEKYGTAIGVEARGKGWNVLLGPTVDIDRNPRNGRESEAYGEDPLVSGLMGAAVAKGFQKNDVIAQLKHFTVYNQEEGRNSLDVIVSERALREVYYPAFEHAIRDGGALSVMGSYPKVNGVYACQNEHIITALKQDLGLKGYLGTDYYPSGDRVEEIKAGVDSAALTPDTPKEAFTDGRIPKERTTDAARRILYALFASGAYDNPLPAVPAATVTTDAHQALARITGEQATVLLKNADGLLPLSKRKTIAVIGPAGKDAMTGVEGSSYVDPGDFTTAVDAIRAKTGAGRVLFSQGSLGDVALPTIPGDVFTAPDGTPGLHAEFFAGEFFAGDPLATTTAANVDFRWGNPVSGLPSTWSARWTGRITPPTTGWVRFSTLLSGAAKLVVDGVTVFDNSRFLWDSFFGPKECALGGVTQLTAGKPVDITVEYTTKDAGFYGPSMKLCWQPDSLIPAAVETAKKADVAVVFVNNYTGEAIDRDDLALPGDQNQLIDAVAAVNPDTVVVLNTSGPMLMPWLGRAKTVLQAWYQGAATGTSIANILYGDAEPGGRLPVTFPANEEQGPSTYRGGKNDSANGSITYDEGIYVGYKWYDKHHAKPLFPFGYGLSYTSFSHDRLRVTDRGRGDLAAEVSVEVRNTGRRTGSDVVQVYIGHLPTNVDTPAKKLAGFAKVTLKPGERRTVSVPVTRRTLSYWDESKNRWMTPSGKVSVYVGSSAADVEYAGTVTVK